MALCATCSKPLPAREGRGRPPTYCSIDCRRRKEYDRASWDLLEHNREYLEWNDFGRRMLEKHPAARP